MNARHVKLVILAASSVLNCGMMSSAILADISRAFPLASEASVQMILTSTSLVAMVCALASGPLSKKITIKTLLVFALAVPVFGGALGFLFGQQSFALLYAVSATIGVGQGMCSTLTLILIADFFEGEQRGNLLGLQSALVNGGGMLIVFISGLLAGIVWNAAYLILFGYIILIVITVKYLPKHEPEQAVAPAGTSKGKDGAYGLWVYYWFLMMFAYAVLVYVYMTNVSLFMSERSLGDATMSGISNAVMLGTGCVSGFLFGRLKRIFKKTLAFAGFASMGVGLLCAYAFGTLPAVLFAAACCGFGMSVIYPLTFFMVSNLVSPAQSAVALAVTTSCSNVGMFLSPLIMNPLSNLFSFGGVIDTRFVVAAALCFVFAIIGLFAHKGERKII